jgi:hypothetical protein
MGIRLGFAGTVRGMTAAQQQNLLAFVKANDVTEFRSGGCVGADQEATEIVCVHTTAKVIVCRQLVEKIESKLVLAVAAEVVKQPRKAVRRNKEVVDASDVVILAPKANDTEGGTLSTFKYARWACKRVLILWPEGDVKDVTYRPAEWWVERNKQKAATSEPTTTTPATAATA